MSHPTSSNLVPRSMSVLARLRILFANGWVQGGMAILCFGSFLFWVFRPDEDLVESFRAEARVETANGVVTACREGAVGSGEGEDSTWVFVITYRFKTPDGAEHRGHSYVEAHERPVEENQPVVVEYSQGHPGNSCIKGMRATTSVHLALLFLLPVVAPAAMVLAGLRSGWKAVHLLRNGLMATGVLTEAKRTIVSVGGSHGRGGHSVFRLTFEFKAADGLTYQTVARTHRLGGPSLGHEQPILYDALDPTRAGVLHAFIGPPSIDEQGVVRVPQAWLAIPALALPLLVFAGNLRGLLHALAW